MKEILVQVNLGHEGVRLITPAPGGDLHCIHPKAISLMTERPLSELEDRPMTKKQQKKNENGCRFRTYMVYNASHDTIILPKNKLVGQCQLILQPNEKAYHQELSAMWQERLAENQYTIVLRQISYHETGCWTTSVSETTRLLKQIQRSERS